MASVADYLGGMPKMYYNQLVSGNQLQSWQLDALANDYRNIAKRLGLSDDLTAFRANPAAAFKELDSKIAANPNLMNTGSNEAGPTTTINGNLVRANADGTPMLFNGEYISADKPGVTYPATPSEMPTEVGPDKKQISVGQGQAKDDKGTVDVFGDKKADAVTYDAPGGKTEYYNDNGELLRWNPSTGGYQFVQEITGANGEKLQYNPVAKKYTGQTYDLTPPAATETPLPVPAPTTPTTPSPTTTPTTTPEQAEWEKKYTELQKQLEDQNAKYSDLVTKYDQYVANRDNYQNQRDSMAGDKWVPGSPWTPGMYQNQADASITQPAYQRTQFNQTTANQTKAPTFTPWLESVPYQYEYANGMQQQRIPTATNTNPYGSSQRTDRYGNPYNPGGISTDANGNVSVYDANGRVVGGGAVYNKSGGSQSSMPGADYFNRALSRNNYDTSMPGGYSIQTSMGSPYANVYQPKTTSGIPSWQNVANTMPGSMSAVKTKDYSNYDVPQTYLGGSANYQNQTGSWAGGTYNPYYGGTNLAGSSGGQYPSYSMLASSSSPASYGPTLASSSPASYGTIYTAGTPRGEYDPTGGHIGGSGGGGIVVRDGSGRVISNPPSGDGSGRSTGGHTTGGYDPNNPDPNQEPSGKNDMNADLMNAASMYYGTGNYFNTYGPAGSTPMYGGREFKSGYILPQEAESRYAQGAQYEQYLPQIFQAYTQGMPTIPDMPQWAAPTADYGSGNLRSGLQTAATQPDRSMITENAVGNSIYDMINRISGAQGSGNLTQDIQSQIANAIAPQDAYNQTLRDQMVADAERNFAAEKTKAIDDAKRYFGHYNLSGSSAELAKLKEIEDEYAKRSDDIRRAIDIQTAQNAQTMQQNRLPQLISALTGISGTDQNALNLGLNLLGSQQSGVNNEYSRLMAALNEATGAQTTNRANTLSDYLTQRQEGLDQYNLGQQNFTNLAQILGMTGNLYDQFRGTGYDLMQGNADAMANLAAGYLSRAATRSANTQGWANLLGNLAGSGAMAAATYGSGGGVQ